MAKPTYREGIGGFVPNIVANLKHHLSPNITLTAKNHFGSQASETTGHLH